MLTSEVKKELVKIIVPFVQEHQKARQYITDEHVRHFMDPHPLDFAWAKEKSDPISKSPLAIIPQDKPTSAPTPAKAEGKKQKGKASDISNITPQSDISRINIKVGKIIHVEKHPEAEKLYVEQIDVGEPTPRTVVSGLVQFIPIEQLKDRLVLVITNLPARALKGVISQGMVLAASNETGDKVELLTVPEGAQIGERITFEGEIGYPDAELNPKHKVFDRVKNDLKTNAEHLACYQNKLFMTSKGPVTASLANANIG